MRVALLGGTGDIGEALALRLGHDTDHDVVVGSRHAEKAADRAADYEATLADHGGGATIEGLENAAAADGADIAVLAVPAYYARSTVEAVADSLGGAVLVSPVVGLDHDEDGFHYDPPEGSSLTELVAGAAPAGTPVVGAFHNLPAGRGADLDWELGLDIGLVGDDADAKATVRRLVDGIDGLRPVDVGGLANAAELEAVTPLLLNVGHHGGDEQQGVRFS